MTDDADDWKTLFERADTVGIDLETIRETLVDRRERGQERERGDDA